MLVVMGETLEQLYKSGLKFLIPLTAQETFVTLVEEARKIVGAKYGTVLLLMNNKLTRVYTSLPIPLTTTSRDKGFSHKAFLTGEPLVVSGKEVLAAHPELRKIHLKQSVIIPLSYYNHELGVLSLAVTTNRKIKKKDLMMLKIFGAIASLSIRKTQLYTQTKDALETRDLFISMVSHELKTPLTAMNMYTHLLEKKLKDSEENTQALITSLSHELHLFTRIISELLNIEQLQSGKLLYTKQVIDIQDIVFQAIAECRVLYPYHTIQFTPCEATYFVHADPDKLLQVFQNILNNAAKFTKQDKTIQIICKQKDKEIVIEIIDNGIGIAKKDLKNIFDKFYKGKNHYQDGIGLGLFLSKSIIHSHHGAIAIASHNKKGTVVTITLPLLTA